MNRRRLLVETTDELLRQKNQNQNHLLLIIIQLENQLNYDFVVLLVKTIGMIAAVDCVLLMMLDVINNLSLLNNKCKRKHYRTSSGKKALMLVQVHLRQLLLRQEAQEQQLQ